MEPSVLVKLFKDEAESDKVIRLISLLDKNPKWYTASSRWSLLEVARALRKDGKTAEIIELDLRELQSHRIIFLGVSDKILSEAENLIATTNVYASDAVHVSTFKSVAHRFRLEGFLCEDTHYERFKGHVPVRSIADLSL